MKFWSVMLITVGLCLMSASVDARRHSSAKKQFTCEDLKNLERTMGRAQLEALGDKIGIGGRNRAKAIRCLNS